MIIRYARSGFRDFNKDEVPINSRTSWELYLVSEGSVAPVFPDLDDQSCQESTIWVMPPGLSYGWKGPGLARRHVAHFTTIPNTLKAILLERGYISCRLNPEELEQMLDYFSILEENCLDSHFLSPLKIEKGLIEMILLLLSKFDTSSFEISHKEEELCITQACEWYINNMNKAPTMEQVAEKVHISGGHFRRLFKKVRKQAPLAYFMELRMNRAKALLLDGRMPSEGIARECGFASASAFFRSFKKNLNSTPKEWLQALNL